jgi:hypothetical protein
LLIQAPRRISDERQILPYGFEILDTDWAGVSSTDLTGASWKESLAMSVQKQISSSLATEFLALILVAGLGRTQGLLGDLMTEWVVNVDLWAADKKGRAADLSPGAVARIRH